MDPIVTDAWGGCYNDSWQGLITPESFAHPAKMSLGLLRRIFAHAKAEGWLQPKAIVLDPFAGIGTTALEALLNGCAFQGCELEPRFFLLAQTNIAQWIHAYRHLPTFGPWAMVVNGDSRRLLEHIPAQAGCAVGSPPWTNQLPSHDTAETLQPLHDALCRAGKTHAGGMGKSMGQSYGTTPGNLANMAISSPPYAQSVHDGNGIDQAKLTGNTPGKHSQAKAEGYGHTPGNLADMTVASPPYAGAGEVLGGHNGIDWTKTTGTGQRLTPGRAMQPYGTTEGQLGAMAPGMVVSSPPFTDVRSLHGRDPAFSEAARPGRSTTVVNEYGATPGNLASLSVSSPPYSTSTQVNNTPGNMTAGKARWAGGTDSAARVKQDYAEPETPGNLASLAVSSPPYADGCDQKGRDKHPERMAGSRTGYLQKDHAGYGGAEGNLADMVASSPPWNQSLAGGDGVADRAKWFTDRPKTQANHHGGKVGTSINADYGSSPGQLGQEEATTFWEAARAVVAQTYALLKPGAHAIWVCKRYVRNGEIVEFSLQWAALCQSVGFEWVHHHKAMLVEDLGEQETLFGETEKIQVQRKSFFRRLYEKRPGAARIDWEDVLCFVKKGT